MKSIFLIPIFGLLGMNVSAQDIDTLIIHSKYMDSERTVYVHKPEFYTYQSDEVKLPVIYILDAQHEWFIEPTLNTIRYLQYTHEIPQAIVVAIPLEDRIKECWIASIDGEPLPLQKFIAEELSPIIKAYNTNDYNVIVGHSFSASFALYAYLRDPDFYSAVLANSPLHQLDSLIMGLEQNNAPPSEIFLSVGGINPAKDKYHREKYNLLKTKYPAFFNSITTFEANESAHNAVPILANPIFLTSLFEKFSYRFNDIAKVDMNYELIEKPGSVAAEMQKINSSTKLNDFTFSMEIPEINGITSRYISNEYFDYAVPLYETGIALYPSYYEFHWYLGELYLELGQYTEKVIEHLKTSKSLIAIYETELKDKEEILFEIDKLLNAALNKK